MKSFLVSSFVSAACITCFTLVSDSVYAASFSSTLTGDQQVAGAPPGPFSPAPTGTDGSGTATLELTGGPGSWVLNYEVIYSGLEGVVEFPYAHIHQASVGQNGPVVHDLDGASVPPIAGSSAGTITGDWRFDDDEPLTDDLAMDLMNSNLYFNLHTDLFPSGEIRGQIIPETDPGVAVPESNAVLGLVLFGTPLGVVRK